MVNNEKDKIADGRVEEVLGAAAEVFAEQGYAGARMEEIARRAGLNKAMLYYYVGGKEALYRRVIATLFDQVLGSVREAVAAASSSEERLRAFVGAVVGVTGGSPVHAPIILRELASGFANMPPEGPERMGPVFMTFIEIVERGVEEGVFKPRNPYTVYFMILGGALMYRTTAAGIEKFGDSSMIKTMGSLRPESPGRAAEEIAETVLSALGIK